MKIFPYALKVGFVIVVNCVVFLLYAFYEPKSLKECADIIIMLCLLIFLTRKELELIQEEMEEDYKSNSIDE